MVPRTSSLLLLGSLPLCAHHGQDFLVTLDTGTPEPWHFATTFGFEFTEQPDGAEVSSIQAITLGLPSRFSVATTFRFADEGTGAWDSLSLTPSLQWNAPALQLSQHATLTFALTAGWELPLSTSSHDHSHNDDVPLQDCSALIGIPALYQACLLANHNRQNHSHDDEGHSHDGIHRHGESHGYLRLVAELKFKERDRLAANFVSVFPEDGNPAYGYALAYRHSFTHHLAAGLEATGDFDLNGEHLLYLTGSAYLTHDLSLTLGAGTGLTSESPNYSLQALATWRF